MGNKIPIDENVDLEDHKITIPREKPYEGVSGKGLGLHFGG